LRAAAGYDAARDAREREGSAMPKGHEFGLAGVDLTPGDHICAMYLGQNERDDVVLPYLRTGLRAGDKCVCIIDSSALGELVARIGDRREVEGYLSTHQLEVGTADHAYLRTPPFTTEGMIEYWESTVGAAMSGGLYAFARVAGEMPWEMRLLPARNEFFRYEAALNKFAPRYPQAILCLYDLERFGGGFMVDLLRTHPKLFMGGLILENPHYRAPDDLAAAAPG
jgi:hypothetical protein